MKAVTSCCTTASSIHTKKVLLLPYLPHKKYGTYILYIVQKVIMLYKQKGNLKHL